MFQFDRSRVLVSQPAYVRQLPGESSSVLVKFILADLVIQDSAKGFVKGSNTPNIVKVDRKLRQVIRVGGKYFILGDQIIRDHLSERATMVHLAREASDHERNYCHKSSWPYEIHPHEGLILQELQDISGMADVIARDSADSNLDLEDIRSGYCEPRRRAYAKLRNR
jgi:hypothetical protein